MMLTDHLWAGQVFFLAVFPQKSEKGEAFDILFRLLLQASKAGLRIYRPGMKMEEEESQGWISWMWNWGAQPDTERKEVKTGGRLQIDMYMWNVFVVTACNISFFTPPMSVPFILLTISVSGFDELLTPAEKAKLYTAIGYSETAANPNLPKDVSHFPPRHPLNY